MNDRDPIVGDDDFTAASDSPRLNRRQLLAGGAAAAAMTTLPGCSSADVPADRDVDIVLIGGGIMSATLGAMLKQLEPNWSIELFERLDAVARESSNAWHNSGTGHSALCELNYTPEEENGSILTDRALRVNEQFQVTRQFYASMVRLGEMQNPRSFINTAPHMSFVRGDRDVDFLQRRYEALRNFPLYSGMQYTTDPEQIGQWAPLLMDGRASGERLAATWSSLGTDVDYGEVTRQLMGSIDGYDNANLNLSTEVEDLQRNDDGSWKITYRNRVTDELSAVNARSVFIGAGGAALLLLQKSGISQASNFAGFPVGGSFLVNDDPAVAERHLACAYGRAGPDSPPMSTPHLDTRFVDGQRHVAFGPFATWSSNFLMNGSPLALFQSMKLSNIAPMLEVGLEQFGLVRYLVGELMQTREDRIEQLREFFPAANEQGWRLVQAGQRVQIVEVESAFDGSLEFGTDVVASDDGSLAALLGASPGASTAPSIMLQTLERMFPDRFQSETWQDGIRDLIPSFGSVLNDSPDQLQDMWVSTSSQLELRDPPQIDSDAPVTDQT